MTWQRSFVRLTLLFLAALTVGCGSKPAVSVSGQVIYDGEPVADGALRFDPLDGGGASGSSAIKDGKFSIPFEKGLTAGKFKVAIYGNKETGESVAAFEALEEGDPTEVADVQQFIPKQYNVETRLTVELEAGENADTDFDLQPIEDDY
ncbi:MAG: hypothetical protein CMJ78_24405 [Planctomycetaceae bacterium]|nr:hypothetical protein [Planctomycetaceae bacterium]